MKKMSASFSSLLYIGLCCNLHLANFHVLSLEIEETAGTFKKPYNHLQHHRNLRSSSTAFMTKMNNYGCGIMESEGDCTEMGDCMWCDIKLNGGPNHRQTCFHFLSVKNDEFEKNLLKCTFKHQDIQKTIVSYPNNEVDGEEEHHSMSAHMEGPHCKDIEDMKGCTGTSECMWCEYRDPAETPSSSSSASVTSYACQEYKPDDFEWEMDWKNDPSIIECALPTV